MIFKQLSGTTITIYSSPAISIHSWKTKGIICTSVSGFGAGSMDENDINPDDEAL